MKFTMDLILSCITNNQINMTFFYFKSCTIISALLPSRETNSTLMSRLIKNLYKIPLSEYSTANKIPGGTFKKPLLERVLSIRKVARVNSGGKIRSTSALVVVGDMNGNAGYGMGRSSDTMGAVQKATEQAKKNMKSYLR